MNWMRVSCSNVIQDIHKDITVKQNNRQRLTSKLLGESWCCTWQWPLIHWQCKIVCYRVLQSKKPAAEILTDHLWVIHILFLTPLLTQVAVAFFILRGGEMRTDTSWHEAIHSTFWPRRTNAAQHLSASANWNMPPCCWEVQVCVYVVVCGYT